MSHFRYIAPAAVALLFLPVLVAGQDITNQPSTVDVPSYVGSPSNPIGQPLPPEKPIEMPVEVPMPMMQFPPLQSYQFEPAQTLRTDPAAQVAGRTTM